MFSTWLTQLNNFKTFLLLILVVTTTKVVMLLRLHAAFGAVKDLGVGGEHSAASGPQGAHSQRDFAPRKSNTNSGRCMRWQFCGNHRECHRNAHVTGTHCGLRRARHQGGENHHARWSMEIQKLRLSSMESWGGLTPTLTLNHRLAFLPTGAGVLGHWQFMGAETPYWFIKRKSCHFIK